MFAGTRQKLREERDYTRAIVDASLPLLVLDADLRVKTANKSFYKHFRVAPSQTENHMVYELGNGQWNIPNLRSSIVRTLSDHNEFKDFEVTHEFQSIGRRSLLVSGSPVDSVHGILLCFNDTTDRAAAEAVQCDSRDVTKRKQVQQEPLVMRNESASRVSYLEQAVLKRTGELHEITSELEELSYSISHDMRAPLRAMQGFAQFLVEEYSSKLDEAGVNYLNKIMRSAVRMDQLILDVLSYSGLQRGELKGEVVDMDHLVRDIADSLPDSHSIKHEIQIKGMLPMVMGNEALLTQCVSSLLSNGTKFVSCGTTPRMEISAIPIGDSQVRIWFQDNGIGIAPENHERIFRLFERLHPSGDYAGTGTGLAIVRKAIKRMGAHMGLESELGKGSKFWIQLKKG